MSLILKSGSPVSLGRFFVVMNVYMHVCTSVILKQPAIPSLRGFEICISETEFILLSRLTHKQPRLINSLQRHPSTTAEIPDLRAQRSASYTCVPASGRQGEETRETCLCWGLHVFIELRGAARPPSYVDKGITTTMKQCSIDALPTGNDVSVAAFSWGVFLPRTYIKEVKERHNPSYRQTYVCSFYLHVSGATLNDAIQRWHGICEMCSCACVPMRRQMFTCECWRCLGVRVVKQYVAGWVFVDVITNRVHSEQVDYMNLRSTLPETFIPCIETSRIRRQAGHTQRIPPR